MKKRIALLFCVGLCVMACSNGNVTPAAKSGNGAVQISAMPQSLSATGEQQLQTIIASGRLDNLQWPNFSSDQPAVKEFYDQSAHRLGWVSNGRPTPQALEMIGLLQHANEKGLDPKDYDGERWADRLKALQSSSGAPEGELVKFDLDLTVSGIRYASDLHLGKVDPKVLHKNFDPDREKHNPGEFLWKSVVGAADVKQAMASIEPPYPGYQRTVAVLQRYLQIAKDEAPDPLPQVSKPVLPGQPYEAVDKLVRRLQFLGDLPTGMPIPDSTKGYTGEVVDGVKRFQMRHGLEAAGKLGPQTIMELNRPMSDRLESLRLTLERWRWIPDNISQPPIIVNIPEFVLRAYDSPGKPALVMRVVVGRAIRTQTPLLEEDMKYVVFWPYWNVPPSILRGEIIPKIVKDPAYLQKSGFEVTSYSGQVVTDGVVSDEVLAQLRAGKLMVRQKPGPKNALGLIKFIFPNDQNIYLHSTPAQALFSETRRDFSHGCIRVENPQALAEWVLRNNPGWTAERIVEAFQAQKEQQVNLTNQIPVFLVYGTAIVKENGDVFFFDDIYGYDNALKKAFDNAYAADQ